MKTPPPGGPADDGSPFGGPIHLPLDGTLDLHAFSPADVGTLVPEWLQASRDAGLRELRIVHGKGTGALRRSVEAILEMAPEDVVDRRLAAIWAEMLGIDRVGADDSFFELGGSSLLAVHMMGRVRKEYPVELSVTTLFEAPTVRALGGLIRSRSLRDDKAVSTQDRRADAAGR